MTKCPRRSSTRPAGDVGDIVVTVVVGLGTSVGTGISVGDEGPPGEVGASVGVEGNSPKRVTLNESIRMMMTGSIVSVRYKTFCKWLEPMQLIIQI